MKTWLIRIGIGVVVIIALVGILKMYQCRKKAKKSGYPFKCSLFKSEPSFLKAQRQYYKVDEDGKCQRVTDYGNKMSFKEVSMSYCR